MAQSGDGWDLEGIPKPWWPYVRDILAAREIYSVIGHISDKAIGKSLERAAEGLLQGGARHLAEFGAKS